MKGLNGVEKEQDNYKKKRQFCIECEKPLDPNNEYHQKYGACNANCYGKAVGEYTF